MKSRLCVHQRAEEHSTVVGFSSINARVETVDTTLAFRDAWKKGQRCLIIADGFFEWK
jgi:putative SOS response-associated peptidase YedK